MKRRTFLATGLSLPIAWRGILAGDMNAQSPTAAAHKLPSGDRDFLQEMQRRCYQYFLDAADPATGLVADRGAIDGSWFSDYASSAACGFALTGHSIAATNGWIQRAEASERTELMLRSLLDLAEHRSGFVYHFFSRSSGKRALRSEASSIDTALMLAGVMTAATTFADNQSIVTLADELYRRVDWQWMLGDNGCLHMGWTPERGRMCHQWDHYSELILLVLMAIGAPANAIDPSCWNAWRREPVLQYEGEEFLSYPPLFVHQYPMVFFDFRDRRSPSGRSYWNNAVRAHRAHIAFLSELANRYPQRYGHYGPELWGLTSSDSESGYRDWGGPYQSSRFEPDRGIDGTLVPSAAAGGLAVVPDQAIETLRYQYDHFGEAIFGRYGFVNAYNPVTNWIGSDVIGIDTGISLLMAENLLSGNVWNAFMKHPAATRALDLVGFSLAQQT